jgi:hypothetical protein
VNNVLSYIGRSLYTADPYAPIKVDEFRIWNGALTTTNTFDITQPQFYRVMVLPPQ